MVLYLQNCRRVHIEYECEVKEILTHEDLKSRGITPMQFPIQAKSKLASASSSNKEAAGPDGPEPNWAVYVLLTNGNAFGCDFVVSATGVTPNSGGVGVVGGGALELAEDGGIKVDKEMRTSLRGIYAAGDICTPQWDHHSNLWFQVGVY